MNNKSQVALIALIVIVVVIIGCVLFVIGAYNNLVTLDVSTSKAWGNVETAYQRRADLIPNLVATVKGAANFEKSTYVAVTEARTQWLSASTPEEQMAAGQNMESALARLLVTVESYPDLKATQNFLSLQDELAGTANRLKFEQDNYNAAVQSYQMGVRRFPSNIFAGMFGFSVDKWKMFKAANGATTNPVVNFTD